MGCKCRASQVFGYRVAGWPDERWGLQRVGPTQAPCSAAYRAHSLKDLHLPQDGGNAFLEGRLEQDAEDSFGEVGDLGELEQEPARSKREREDVGLVKRPRRDPHGCRVNSYCSGLSSGLASALSLEALMCFMMPSSSSAWALCERTNVAARVRKLQHDPVNRTANADTTHF